MNKIKLSILGLAILSIQSFANPWKECGIGAIIFDDNGTLATVVNLIWDWGTTATSSDMSSPNTCKGRKGKAAMFINEAYPSLEKETVKGNGQHIDSMLTILNCDVESHEAITASIRSDFATELAKDADLTRTEKAEAYYNIVDANTAKVCTI